MALRAAAARRAACRSPHGERGLKYHAQGEFWRGSRSLSSWRAWIEMREVRFERRINGGRSPHGERGLKSESE